MAVIDAKKNFPLTTRRSVMIRPGYTVLGTKRLKWTPQKLCFQNVVSLGATKVTPNENIRSAEPVKRNCYFGDEYHLTAHQNYSQVRAFSEISKIYDLKHLKYFIGGMLIGMQYQVCPFKTE